jgi:hypothetical protein
LALEYSFSSMRSIQIENQETRVDQSGCLALWRAVIYRAFCDACYQYFEQHQLSKHSSLGAGNISRENALLGHQAREFLLADMVAFPLSATWLGLTLAFSGAAPGRSSTDSREKLRGRRMTAALPAFITRGTKVKLKKARKRATKTAERFTGDTGTKGATETPAGRNRGPPANSKG